MNELQQEWKYTRQLTIDLLNVCSTADLDLRLIPQCEPLWKQFRHMGRVHENYLSTLTFGQVKFDTLGGSYDGKASKLDLNDYFEWLEK